MPRKKPRPVSVDAMVKLFIRQYNIPTRKDVDKLMARMDRLERMIKSLNGRKSAPCNGSKGRTGGPAGQTASDTVLAVIKQSRSGMGIADIQTHTGFGEKKLRNIVFRLHKMEKIKRINRGRYIAA